MARKVEVTLIDDIDGGKAARTVEFSLDGRSYQIDLGEDNIAALEQALAPFVEKARQVSGARRRGGSRAPAGKTAGDKAAVSATEVRAWAAAEGIEVSSRGRIPREVMDAFLAAH